jgi:hypothetical protein
VKKERGKKLIQKARETIVRRDFKRLIIPDNTLTGKDGRRLTRRLLEKIETEKFQEAKLEALYSGKTGSGLVISQKHPSCKQYDKDSPVNLPSKRASLTPGNNECTPPKRCRKALPMDELGTGVIDLTMDSPCSAVSRLRSTPSRECNAAARRAATPVKVCV